MRELRVRVDKKGFRTKQFVVVTSLLDPVEYPAKELAGLYRARWHAELDIRSIKDVMQMDVLRCKTPEMVRKEIWGTRAGIQSAARGNGRGGVPKGIATARAQLPGSTPGGEELPSGTGQSRLCVAEVLRADALEAIADERVGERPDRYEPRARKRREKMYPRLKEPRRLARNRLAKAG